MTNNMEYTGNKNVWLRQAIFESALILVGIVLGFWVNEWREDIEKKNQGDAALARIVEEIQDNRAALKQILPYHTKVLNNLVEMQGNVPDAPMIETFLDVIAPNGIGDLLLQDEAWKTAIARDSLMAIDFGIVQDIAAVYNLADFGAKNMWNSTIMLFNEKEAFLAENAPYMQKRYMFNYSNLVSQEKYLMERYDQLLKKLGADQALKKQ